ncbi:MAG: class I SAM-dependent methyltransferase [Planctomycetota bacterium]|nr:MAG: class I SAM-dependent methyltransferase [Planctomycetota bacterium]
MTPLRESTERKGAPGTTRDAGNVPEGWALVACPLCGRRDHDVVFAATCALFDTAAEVTLRRCTCGLLLTNPQPQGPALAAFYATDAYYTHRPPRGAAGRLRQALRRWQLRGPLCIVRRAGERWLGWSRYAQRLALDAFPLRRGMRLLDFGCGNGDFLHTARALGLHAAGVEPDEAARSAARRGGASVYESLDALESDSQNAAKFDRITLKHVLEHLSLPVETVARLGERLAPGGRMLIAVPNAASLQAERFREHWIGYDMPRHLWHFDADALARLVERANLRVVTLRSVELEWFASESNAVRQRAGLQPLAYRAGSLRRLERTQRGAELVVVARASADTGGA